MIWNRMQFFALWFTENENSQFIVQKNFWKHLLHFELSFSNKKNITKSKI